MSGTRILGGRRWDPDEVKKLFENWNSFINESTSPEEDNQVVDVLRTLVGQWKPAWDKLNPNQRELFFDLLLQNVNVHREAALAPPEDEGEEEEIEI